MNKILTNLILSLFMVVILTPSVSAQMMDQEMLGRESSLVSDHQSLGHVLPEILSKYQVSKIQDLDCDDVSTEDFELLGDVIMESRHPGKIHESMDEMMGGEGSDSLEKAHISMGKNYLGCYDNNETNMLGSMGHNFVMPMMQANKTLLIQNNLFGLVWFINSLLITVLLSILIRYYWRKSK